MSFEFDTEKGELCTIECWQDEDREERYQDGGRDLIWIDRIHSNQYGDIESYISAKFADISDTIYIDIHACRSSTVIVYEKGDEFYDVYLNNISIEEIGDDCLGGGEYVWKTNQLINRYSLA